MLYVDELVVPDAINTMPEATLHAFADHGDVQGSFDWSSGAAAETPSRGRRRRRLDAITAELERAGVESFCQSYEELLDCIESKLAAIALEAPTAAPPTAGPTRGGPVPLEPGTRGRA